ncbi:MAG: hypothetical protein LC750_14375 [Actinobacteria bacterium]|nr:hypothetical protein [Actinomycetota bacterium]
MSMLAVCLFDPKTPGGGLCNDTPGAHLGSYLLLGALLFLVIGGILFDRYRRKRKEPPAE